MPPSPSLKAPFMPTRFVLLKEKKLKTPILLTGLPGIGLVGKIAVDYLVKQTKAEKIALLYSDSFPPSVFSEKGVLNLIADELYHLKSKGQDYLFLAGPVQPSLDMRGGGGQEHYEFAEAIIHEAKKLGVKELYTLAGINIGEKRLEKEPGIVIAATDEKILASFKKTSVEVTQDGGMISGAAGLLLGIGKRDGMKGACLMGETNAKLIYGDHAAARRLLELLQERFGFTVDMSSIEKESKTIQEAFEALNKQIQARMKRKEDLEGEKSSLTYVR